MQHEALLGLAFKAFNAPRIVRRAQRSGNQRLRFTASKYG